MPPNREIELKLKLPSESLRDLKRSALLRSSKGKAFSVESVYFDTDKHKLRQHGVSLRLRRQGRKHVQTIKHTNGPGTSLDRGEWETNVSGDRPDLHAAQGTALEPLLNKKLAQQLKPLFKTRSRRTVIPVRHRGSQIEIVIDKGTIDAGRKSTELCELELELKRGKPAALFGLARSLATDLPADLVLKSKAKRGYSLALGKAPQAIKVAPVSLAANATAQAAFQAIARGCLYLLTENIAVFRHGDEVALHQIRVALRRMRSAISLFPQMLTDPETGRLKGEFKWLANELAPARELDVFLNDVVKPVCGNGFARPETAALQRDIEKRRNAAYQRAASAINSVRTRHLLLDAMAWIEVGEWLSTADDLARTHRERAASEVAVEQLQRRRKRILKRGRHLQELPADRLHRLRVQSKKLRYAAEFFSDLFEARKQARRQRGFMSSLKQLQESLGQLNDIAVHEQYSERLVQAQTENSEATAALAIRAFAVGRLAGREEGRRDAVLEQAKAAFDSFSQAKPFWK
jgi:inorganic triphosphatase YgiF